MFLKDTISGAITHIAPDISYSTLITKKNAYYLTCNTKITIQNGGIRLCAILNLLK